MKEKAGTITKIDKQKEFSSCFCFVFFNILAFWVYMERLQMIIVGFYAVMSLITFGLYAKDKSAAKSGRWRTSESTLHMFSLLGGWPGAMLAQSYLRHKSIKQPFRFIYWLTVIINVSALTWLLTPDGTAVLKSIMILFAKGDEH